MAGQLTHLLTVMPLPSVCLASIPQGAPRTVWLLEVFYLYDDQHVVIETLTAGISVRQPREITDYQRAFTGLSTMAAYGDAARAPALDATG